PRPARRLSAAQVIQALRNGDCSVEVLAAFCGHYAADGLRHLARSELTGDALATVAAGLRDLELGHDVTTDNDPREHGAHASWHRPSVDLSPQSTEPGRAVAYLALADEPPALIESITRMVADRGSPHARWHTVGAVLPGLPDELADHPTALRPGQRAGRRPRP